MREGARFGTVQTHRVQAGQGEKKGLCLPCWWGGGGTLKKRERGLLMDGERREITGWIT